MSRRTPRPGQTPRVQVAGQVRGVVVMNAIAFLREQYGAAAPDLVLRDLSVGRRATFVAQLREASWEPLADFLVWLEAAQKRFAPDDPGFGRRLGSFAGARERTRGGFGPMVATPAAAMRMGQVLWRTMYDVGKLDVERLGPLHCRVRINEFTCTPLLWQRTLGGFEGLLSTPELRAHARPLGCASEGAACCEMEISWEPIPQPAPPGA